MLETASDLAALDALLTASHARSTSHLRDIIHGDRTLTADDVVRLMTGMKVLSLATVTRAGEPRISAVDGHLLHGTWTWSTSGDAAKARDLSRRPSVSVAHVSGEQFALFAHGTAQRLSPDDEQWDETLAHWTAHYGGSPLEWGPDIRVYRLAPSWMVGYAFDRSALREQFDPSR